jgi:hypothetical protein
VVLSVFCKGPMGARARELQDIRGNSQQNFQKKNGEFLRHRSLDGIENIRVSLQSCGVSRGLEIRKVALRI